MGKGNVPEGLAKVQMDAFERRIQSLQAEAEKIIEQQIFRRILQSNGFDVHVEFEWGQPSNTEKNERIAKLTEILKLPTLSFVLSSEIQKDLAKQLGYEETIFDAIDAESDERNKEREQAAQQKEREREEEEPQPRVPGQNRKESLSEELDKCNCGYCVHGVGEMFNNVSLKEWIGFNFEKYKDKITEFITEDTFDLLKAETALQIEAGRLTQAQVMKLKSVLNQSFEKGLSIREITKLIENKVKPGPLYKLDGNKLVTGPDGSPILQVSKKIRSTLIARTETTRAAVGGSLKHFKEAGVSQVSWVSSIGARTCPECEAMNGQIMSIAEAEGKIPLHVLCRCSFIPIGELG